MSEHSRAVDKLNKILKTLEEELAIKAEKIKLQDSKLQDIKNENHTLHDRIRDVQR